MAQHRTDYKIGVRAAREVFDRSGNKGVCRIMRDLGICEHNYYKWRNGVAPSPDSLQRLALAGYDVEYILIGRKEKKIYNE